MNQAVFAATLATLALAAGTALADPPKAGEEQSGKDWTYTFFTDDLGASAKAAHGAIIDGVPRPIRATLIRPRTQFVSEMLKSVEAL